VPTVQLLWNAAIQRARSGRKDRKRDRHAISA
jgi:hypothetical protein